VTSPSEANLVRTGPRIALADAERFNRVSALAAIATVVASVLAPVAATTDAVCDHSG